MLFIAHHRGKIDNDKEPLGLEDLLLYAEDTSVRAINTIGFWRVINSLPK